jgi:hypothetical protein
MSSQRKPKCCPWDPQGTWIPFLLVPLPIDPTSRVNTPRISKHRVFSGLCTTSGDLPPGLQDWCSKDGQAPQASMPFLCFHMPTNTKTNERSIITLKTKRKMYFSKRVWWLAWFDKNCSWLVYLEILRLKLSINRLEVTHSFIYLYAITNY